MLEPDESVEPVEPELEPAPAPLVEPSDAELLEPVEPPPYVASVSPDVEPDEDPLVVPVEPVPVLEPVPVVEPELITSICVTRTDSPLEEPEKLARTCDPSWMSVSLAFWPSFMTFVLFETLSF